jgi:hypothetical protein
LLEIVIAGNVNQKEFLPFASDRLNLPSILPRVTTCVILLIILQPEWIPRWERAGSSVDTAREGKIAEGCFVAVLAASQ